MVKLREAVFPLAMSTYEGYYAAFLKRLTMAGTLFTGIVINVSDELRLTKEERSRLLPLEITIYVLQSVGRIEAEVY